MILAKPAPIQQKDKTDKIPAGKTESSQVTVTQGSRAGRSK